MSEHYQDEHHLHQQQEQPLEQTPPTQTAELPQEANGADLGGAGERMFGLSCWRDNMRDAGQLSPSALAAAHNLNTLGSISPMSAAQAYVNLKVRSSSLMRHSSLVLH